MHSHAVVFIFLNISKYLLEFGQLTSYQHKIDMLCFMYGMFYLQPMAKEIAGGGCQTGFIFVK